MESSNNIVLPECAIKLEGKEMMKSIGIIATWFGKIPSYYRVWEKSVSYNTTIDFYFITDQDVTTDVSNLVVIKTSLQEEIEKYAKIIGKEISICNAYKFCDCRLFFGLFYKEIYAKYDFWGYCDIDLAFGDIRSFVSEDALEKYDRIYQYGHLCIYRNTEKMCNLYDLPGGIYTYSEIFEGKAKTTPEEHFGANRICIKNSIMWYTEVDFADLNSTFGQRLEQGHQKENADIQVFLWDNGKTYRLFYKNGIQHIEELVYIHWQKKNPVIMCEEEKLKKSNCIIITADKFVLVDKLELTETVTKQLNPPINEGKKIVFRLVYIMKKIWEFITTSGEIRKIWGRQIRYRVLDKITGERTYK